MKWTSATLVCLSLFIPRLATAEAETHAITGVYLASEEDHKIALFMHGTELRGKIVWTRENDVRDENNEDPSLRSRSLVGIVHLRGLHKQEGEDVWTGGVLYNPENGKTYDAKLWFDGDRLVIRGKPRIAVVGGLLGALFGRIEYTRVGPWPSEAGG